MVSLANGLFPVSRFPNLSFECCDARSLAFECEFEVVFSNAALHWVRGHRSVLEGIRNALKAGGRALLQMGGFGNARSVVEVFNELTNLPRWRTFFLDFEFPYGFYAPDEYREWLHETGLVAARVELIPKDMVHAGRSAFIGWIRTTWIPYTHRVPEQQRRKFLEEFVDRYFELRPPDSAGNVHVDMLRLEVEAVRK
jgi:trans-aconitate methyltransferase